VSVPAGGRERRGLRAHALGVDAEGAACAALERDGWEVRARRLRTKAGEVDVVAEKDGLLALDWESRQIVPKLKPDPPKRAITLRLPTDLIAQIERESIADGRKRERGRVYSPSATVERILRGYFSQAPRRGRSRK